MRIHIAMSNSKLYFDIAKRLQVENLLISYAFFPKLSIYAKMADNWYPKNLIIDSGAFSVWSRGETINIDNYAKFCNDIKQWAPGDTNLYFVNLDVLPGKFGRVPTKEEREESARKGWENMLYLESKGLKVIHVFHQHEDFKWLEKMTNHSDYIGLSPANDMPQQSKDAFLSQCFNITRNKIKCHGFAVTSYSQLLQFPFFSVDSSSWAAGVRFARIPIVVNGKIKSFNFKNKDDLLKNWHHIGSENKDILNNYGDRAEVGIQCYQKFNEFITDTWAKRGVIWKN